MMMMVVTEAMLQQQLLHQVAVETLYGQVQQLMTGIVLVHGVQLL